MNNDEIICSLASWLNNYSWSWFATLTFRFEVSDPLNAKKYFRRWIVKDVQTRVSVPVRYFVAVERFRHNLGTHLHSLIWVGVEHTLFGVKNVLIMPHWRAWVSRYGAARILLYDRRLGARYYLGKYITKEICDWDFCLPAQTKQTNN